MDIDVPDGWELNGPHLIRFEAPNLFMTRSRGDVRKEHMERTFAIMQEKIDVIGPIYWITNLSEMGKLEAEAQKVKGAPGRVHDPRNVLAIAVVGSSFHLRVVAQLAIKANRLLRRDRTPLILEFFDDETGARQWIETRRARDANR